MLKLIIEDDEGRKTVVPFVRDEITIGRQEGNTIRLTERNVSRKHARLVRVNGHVVVEDLGSYNGIRVNGERIQGKLAVHAGDLIQIGDYDLAIESQPAQAPAPPAPSATAQPSPPVLQPALPAPKLSASLVETAVEEAEPLTETSSDEIIDAEDEIGPEAPLPASSIGSGRVATSVIRGANGSNPSISNAGPQNIPAHLAPKLVLLNTHLAGREFACIRTELLLGRSDENDIPVDHRSLSRTHAKLTRDTDGIWRIHDLQSANGLSVNDDVYAEAVLKPGDELELGHVRFKFVGAGQSFRYTAGPRKRRSWVGRSVGLLAVAGIASFAGYREMQTPGYLRGIWAVISGQAEVPLVTSRPPSGPAAARQTLATVSNDTHGTERTRAHAETLSEADSAYAAREMKRVVALLEPLEGEMSLLPAQQQEVASLLEKARSELGAEQTLSAARQALSAGRLEEAKALLAEADGTEVYARELAELQRAAKKAATRSAPTPAQQARTVGSTLTAAGARNPAAPSADSGEKLFREGTELFVKKQYREALGTYTRCIDVAPSYARCHMMLGSTLARLGQAERGAQHYRTFVRMAPQDPEAGKVKALLEDYERSKRTKATSQSGSSQ